jgi:hypothetical protein
MFIYFNNIVIFIKYNNVNFGIIIALKSISTYIMWRTLGTQKKI